MSLRDITSPYSLKVSYPAGANRVSLVTPQNYTHYGYTKEVNICQDEVTVFESEV